MKQNSKFFYGYASTFNNKDWHKDVVLKDSLHISGGIISLFLEHNPRNKIGEIISISQNTMGIFVEGYIDTKYAKKQIPLSIGYVVNKSFKDKDGIRYIEKFTLIEVSVVKKAANPKAFGFCEN